MDAGFGSTREAEPCRGLPAGTSSKPRLAMLGVLPASGTVLAQPHAVRIVALVLVTGIVPAAAFSARPPETSIVNPALPRQRRRSCAELRPRKTEPAAINTPAGSNPCECTTTVPLRQGRAPSRAVTGECWYEPPGRRGGPLRPPANQEPAGNRLPRREPLGRMVLPAVGGRSLPRGETNA